MRISLVLLAALIAVPAMAQDEQVSCEPLLTAAEVRSACGVSDFEFEISRDSESGCQITARREGTVSALLVTLSVQDTPEAARMAVELARSIGTASDDSRGTADGTNEAGEAIGQVLGMLGMQDADAAATEGVSETEAATRDLPGLGDGGVRYLSDVTSALGVVNHTIVFSSDAMLVKLESGIVADRAGVCTVETLEPLARLVADRL